MGQIWPYSGKAVNIKKLKDSIIKLSQQALVISITADIVLDNPKVKAVPAKVNESLHTYLDKPPFSMTLATGT